MRETTLRRKAYEFVNGDCQPRIWEYGNFGPFHTTYYYLHMRELLGKEIESEKEQLLPLLLQFVYSMVGCTTIKEWCSDSIEDVFRNLRDKKINGTKMFRVNEVGREILYMSDEAKRMQLAQEEYGFVPERGDIVFSEDKSGNLTDMSLFCYISYGGVNVIGPTMYPNFRVDGYKVAPIAIVRVEE